MKKVMIVTGTRPQVIKSSPIIKKLMNEPEIELIFVHTGQHYDYNLFQVFIDDFGLPDPINLEVSGGAVDMVSTIMLKLKAVIEKDRPDLILVPGDTNSALAAGLTAAKMDIPFGHIEAGVREWELNMHEEMNRRILDHSASVLFVPTESGYKHLIEEKVQGKLCLVGDTNYDLFLERFVPRSELSLSVLLTTHRRENIENRKRLTNILMSVDRLGFPIIFPAHPNAINKIKELKLETLHIQYIKPVGYDDMMRRIQRASLVVTDSGGLQKEAFFANKPCVTLREVTTWDETVMHGANMLCGADDQERMYSAYVQMYNIKLNNPNIYGDGNASGRIVDIILNNEIEIPRERAENK
jgi:UDP-GlcNAc3NAcA epimerase